MRGVDRKQEVMFSYVSQEDRIPEDHPLRKIRKVSDEVLKSLSGRFERLYSETGRPSIPPEQLLRALLLQVLYTVRSERLLMEQLNYNMLYRWFVGLTMDDAVWVPTVFTKNRDRLLEGDIAEAFFTGVLKVIDKEGLLSDEHFTVDGTLIEAWASQKSFQKKEEAVKKGDDDPKDLSDKSNPSVDFHGEKRTNDTHESKTDPQARLYRKGRGKEAKLSFMGHVLMENRNGFAVDGRLSLATGTAEREAAQEMVKDIPDRRKKKVTVGADKGYDTGGFVKKLRRLKVTPHIAQNDTNRSSAIDKRTTRHCGYEISQRKRKLVEEIFGWLKTVGLMRKARHRGKERIGWMFTFGLAAYNLLRFTNLQSATC